MKLPRRACGATAMLLACSAAWAASTIDYPGVGTVTVVQPSGAPAQFVVFLSGDGGWNKGVVDMARHLSDEGALVAGVDITQMERRAADSRDACVSAASRLEGLSHFVQQKYGMRHYFLPILVGYSSGATLAYATLAQAPSGTFKGAVSLGFCPDLAWSKPLCRDEGLEHDFATKKGFVYRPATNLHDPWIALQGEQDEVCTAQRTRDFVARVPGAELLSLPKVGHGYSVERNWLPQFMGAFRKVAGWSEAGQGALPIELGDLPLIELPARQPDHDRFAIMLSGDGGWAGLDKEVAAELNARGVPVVGWDSLRYFWSARTPVEAASDLNRVIEHYARSWAKSQVLLVGYSQGADVMPFMVNRLPVTTRRMIASTALIGVSAEAFFKFSVSHWISTPTGGVPVPPEINRGQMGRVSCIYGADEENSPCRTIEVQGLRRIALPGGHHFAGDYARVAGAVLDGLPP